MLPLPSKPPNGSHSRVQEKSLQCLQWPRVTSPTSSSIPLPSALFPSRQTAGPPQCSLSIPRMLLPQDLRTCYPSAKCFSSPGPHACFLTSDSLLQCSLFSQTFSGPHIFSGSPRFWLQISLPRFLFSFPPQHSPPDILCSSLLVHTLSLHQNVFLSPVQPPTLTSTHPQALALHPLPSRWVKEQTHKGTRPALSFPTKSHPQSPVSSGYYFKWGRQGHLGGSVG